MGLFNRTPDPALISEAVAPYANEVEILKESLADLELAMEDEGWLKLSAWGQQEFTREGLRNSTNLSRIMAVANPLIKRGLNVRQAYVWGGGVEIQARSGEEEAQDVNALVQAMLDDPLNQAAWCGDQAREESERALGTDGNLFFALFTAPLDGRVQVRTIDFDQINDIICNPDDRADVWFYERVWTQETFTDTTTSQRATIAQSRREYYPALGHNPQARPLTINGCRVNWDSPVLHVKVNGLKGHKWGIPDAYAAVAWARAYKDFLSDWAQLTKALSKYAYKISKPKSQAQAARQALKNQTDIAGSTVLTDPATGLEAISKTGAQIDSASGKELAGMVAAALGIPVTVLLADPGTTGARAVAETLDKPTQNEMSMRQKVHAQADRAILNYAIDQAIKAPRGPLQGGVTRDRLNGREIFTLANDVDRTIDVSFPPLNQTPIDVLVKAAVDADSTGKIPPLVILRVLLLALGVDDVDQIINECTDEDGNFIDPDTSAGDAAVKAFRDGDDPAARLNLKTVEPDDEEDPDADQQ